MAHAHQGLGDLLGVRGEYLEAHRHYTEALKGFRELKDRWAIAWTLQGIGGASYRTAKYRRAEHSLGKCLALFDLLGDKGGAVSALGTLGMVLRARGHHVRAACILGACSRIQDDLLGPEVTSGIKPDPEFQAAQEKYQAEYPSEWAQGQAMDYKQAVEHVRRFFPRGTL
jgi:tetratricopeptide (TPR) repeat protein